MAKVKLRKKAIEDLNSIWIYTYIKWSESQADKYYTVIKLVCNNIGDNPLKGILYTYLGEEIYGVKSGKHIIFYKILDRQNIEILRILLVNMDIKNRLKDK